MHRTFGSSLALCVIPCHPCMRTCVWLLECSLHPSLYFFLKSFFHLFLMFTLVPDENSMEDPLCNSSFGSMVSLDYVTPDTTSSGDGTCPARRPEEMESTTGRRATPAMRCPRLLTHPIVGEHRVLQGGHDNMGFAVAGNHGKVQDSTLQRTRCQHARIMVNVVLL